MPIDTRQFPALASAATVKICGLTNEADIRCALDNGVDYCGVILFEKSPRFVPQEKAAGLCALIGKGKSVCVAVAPTPEVLEQYAALGFGAFQLHCEADTPADTLAAWSHSVGRHNLWLAPRIAPDAPFPEHFLDFANTVLVDTYQKSGAHGGSGKTGDWERFREWSRQYPQVRFVLAGGLSPENLADAIARSGTRFVDLNSGLESAPGVKDHAKIRTALRIAKGF